MEIYLVLEGYCYEGYDIISVHKSLETARNTVKKLLETREHYTKKPYETTDNMRWQVVFDYIEIVKHELEE